jgi:DNA helicase-2/ATP-dependent DNA helicase PcrA
MHISGGKIQILEAIAEGEPTVHRLLERLQELSTIIREKKYSNDCNFILSTIHSSKGLEYDTVYLIDAKDGVFPEKVITDRKTASQDELMQYEEERRLYYVAVTRAKNNLNIFSFKNESAFTDQLFNRTPAVTTVRTIETGSKADKNTHSVRKPYRVKRECNSYNTSSAAKNSKLRIVTESEYMDKMGEIASSGFIRHRIYGRGKLLNINGDELQVEFAGKTMKCRLKFMMERGLIF